MKDYTEDALVEQPAIALPWRLHAALAKLAEAGGALASAIASVKGDIKRP